MSAFFDDEDDGDPDWIPNCEICNDTGKIIAMDGYHEYLGYNEVPCRCAAAQRWHGQLGPEIHVKE